VGQGTVEGDVEGFQAQRGQGLGESEAVQESDGGVVAQFRRGSYYGVVVARFTGPFLTGEEEVKSANIRLLLVESGFPP